VEESWFFVLSGETNLDVEEEEVDEGEIVSCPECGTDFESHHHQSAGVEKRLKKAMWKRKKKWRPKTVTTPSACRFCLSGCRSSFCLLLLLSSSALAPNLSQLANADSAPKKLNPPTPYALIFGTGLGTGRPPRFTASKSESAAPPTKSPSGSFIPTHHGEFALRVAARQE